MKTIVRKLQLFFFISALFLLASNSYGQTLTTDQADYPPGSTVTLTGSGFAPDEEIMLQVEHVDTNLVVTDSASHEPWYIFADAAGNFTTTWYIPIDGDEEGEELRATADGLESLLHAEALFTDATYCNFQVLSFLGIFGYDNASGNNFWITAVSVNGSPALNFTGGTSDAATPSAGFNQGNFTAQGATVQQGQAYNFSVSRSGNNFGQNIHIWVDYNDNGILNEAGEEILNVALPTSGSLTTGNINYTIPLTAPVGARRMRVACIYNGDNSAANQNPCGAGGSSGAQGDAKDFTLTITAAVACSGAPAVANVSPASAGVCAGSGTTLSLTGLVSASGYTYQWQQSSTSGSGFVNATGTSTNSTYSTPASLPFNPTFYRCIVTCTSSASSTTSNEGQVSLNSFLSCYCIPTYAAANGGTRGIVIAAIGAPASPVINNTSTVNNVAPYYTLYTAASPVSNAGLSLSTLYTLAVKVGTQANALNNVGAWIDYNQNGVFEAGESIGSFASAAANSTTNINFTVPGTALTGVTAMRIRHRYGAAVATGDACTNYSGAAGAGGAGEVEDYRININGAACSGTPTAGTVSPATVSICPNGTTVVSVSGQTSGVSGITFQWQTSSSAGGTYTNVTGGSGATIATYTTPPLVNATGSAVHYFYKCLITCTNGGASAIQTTPVDVTVNPAPVVSVSPSAPGICSSGGSVSLTASNSSDGTTTYSWSPTAGLSPATGATVTATPAVTTTYTVTGTSNSCSGTSNVTVAVNPSVITFSPSAPSIGIGTGVSITASASSTNGGITYAWLPNDGTLSSQSGATVTASPLATETYTVTATDAGGCSRTGTVTVNVLSGTPGLVNCGYVFSASTFSSWSDIAGTPLTNGNNNSVIDLSALSPAFNFDYNGITYNKFGVNGNGWMWLGNVSPAANVTTPISSGLTVDGVIAGFANAQLTGISLQYLVQGSSPNRTLTVQWTGSWNGTAWRMQTILSESTHSSPNVITFNYWDQSNSLTTGGNNIQIGLRGASDTDFNNRSKAASGQMNATSTSAGATANATVNMSSSNWIGGPSFSSPAVNIRFVYTPTIATPTITPAGTQTVCTGNSITLTGNSTLPSSPTPWQWKLSGANVGTNSSSFTVTPAAAGNLFYTVSVTNASGCSRTSSALPVVAIECCPVITFTTSATNATCAVGNTAGSITVDFPSAGLSPFQYSKDDGANYQPGNIFSGLTAGIYKVKVKDTNGCMSASVDVTVGTGTAPAVSTCSGNIGPVNTEPGLCSAAVNYVVAFTNPNASLGDNIVITYSPNLPSGSQFPKGTTTVTVTATNSCGNAACTFNVTVIDAESPVITQPADITSGNDLGDCGKFFAVTNPVSSDNCPGFFFSQRKRSDFPNGQQLTGFYPVGPTTITWGVSDLAVPANVTTTTQLVTINDNENPVFTSLPTIVQDNDVNACGAAVYYGEFEAYKAEAIDNCAIDNIVYNPASGYFFPIGTSTVTVTSTDNHSNSATTTFTVTINDVQVPVINNVPSNITVYTQGSSIPGVYNGTQICSRPVSWAAVTVSDNCQGAQLFSDHNSGDVFPLGTTTVHYFANDANSNNAVPRQFNVTVIDNTKPAITCPANVTQSVNTLTCTATGFVLGNATALDNCTAEAPVAISISSNASASYAGPTSPATSINHTIIWTATDAAGNSNTCSQTLTITNAKPVMTGLEAYAVGSGTPTDIVFVNQNLQLKGKARDESGTGHSWLFNDDAGTTYLTTSEMETPLGGGLSEYTAWSPQFLYAGNESRVAEPSVVVTDACGASSLPQPGVSTLQFLAVATATGGFTTHGGFYYIPSSAQLPTSGQPGYGIQVGNRINSGDVSKYVNGTTCKGQLQHTVHANNNLMNVHVDNGANTDGTMDYLTISNPAPSATCSYLAIFRAPVKIDGQTGNYKILVAQTDGDKNPAYGHKIRVKIGTYSGNSWGTIFYDTQPGAPDGALPTTPLSNGKNKVQPSSACRTDMTVGDILSEVEGLLFNVPNPTNGMTDISFNVPQDGKYTLKVFNSIGQEVVTLFNEEAMADAVYTVKFDGSGMNAGIYTYTIIGDSYIKTSKLSLIKQ